MKQIPLHDGTFAVVNDEDYEALRPHKWHLSEGYPTRSIREGKTTKHVRMHTMIVGSCPPGFITDHENEDKRDNQRRNLRFVTKSVNGRNRRKQPPSGVYFHKKAQKWCINLSHGDKTLYFGLMDTEAEARSVAALLRGALIYHELTKGAESGLR